MGKTNNHYLFKKLVMASIALTLAISPVFSQVHALEKISFENISDNGTDTISLTSERVFEATLVLKGKSKSQVEALASGVNWSLYRMIGEQDSTNFPYQYLGGKLNTWKVFDSTTPYFKTNTKVVSVGKDYAIKLTLTTKFFFGEGMDGVDGRSRSKVRDAILDYKGTYTLLCTDKNGNALGSADVEVRPYDSYRTSAEYEKELNEAAAYAESLDNVYAEVRSMGKTTNGYNMPYIIITDKKSSINDYMKIKARSESDPAALIKEIKSGSLKYKIPVFYSNIHADENPGGDAPMNFIWDIIKADKTDGLITYKVVTGFTAEGEKQLAKEKADRNVHFTALLADTFTGLGFIQGKNEASGVVDLEKYYTVESVKLDVNDLLANVILIVIPNENVDARTINLRTNGNGFDLNRDNSFQTQVETQNMAKLITTWNPTIFAELHGFIDGFQIEPCSPTHGPNFEYDLFIENAVGAGEAFGEAAIANNKQFNSFAMPIRDYLTENDNGKVNWVYPWDDMSTGYTPQYAMLHGSAAFTIEVPEGNEDGTRALEYGLLNNAKYAAEHKDALFINQLTGYVRGINNINAPSISKWYVDEFDNQGAEANILRPVSKENNNYFPEYYVIPVDKESQHDIAAAYEMQAYLLANGVQVKRLSIDTNVNGVNYKAGAFIIDMYQAKRNVANNALAQGTLLTGWGDLYSESITAFGESRGFSYSQVRVKDAFKAKTELITNELSGKTLYSGNASDEVIILNNSLDSIHAINTLLKAGAKVGYITSGNHEGDFITSFANFTKVRNDHVLIAEGTEQIPSAKIIDNAKLYIVGEQPAFRTKSDGSNYGVKNYNNLANNNYNWDVFAFNTQMGFDTVKDLSKADIIVGNQEISSKEADKVKNGTPYIAYGTDALYGISDNILSEDLFEFYHGHPYAIEDALSKIVYVDESITTKKYVKEADNIMYGYGGAYLTKTPKEAKILIKTTSDLPLQGFLLSDSVKGYKDSIQAISYQKDKLDLTIFANSLTNKAHQTNDYRYITNTIYGKMLGEDYK